MKRRHFLAAMGALLLSFAVNVKARIVSGGMPWFPDALQPPQPIKPGSWTFFSEEEVETLSAMANRIIPEDDLGIGAVEAGCVVFIDRQLSGDFGNAITQYQNEPFLAGMPQQGPQDQLTPAEQYHVGLLALDDAARQMYVGKRFHTLDTVDQDALLVAIEAGLIALNNIDGQHFFSLVIQNVREGFFSDPLYGGNRDMVGWKLVGFPGARYDYRREVSKPGDVLTLEPVGLLNNK